MATNPYVMEYAAEAPDGPLAPSYLGTEAGRMNDAAMLASAFQGVPPEQDPMALSLESVFSAEDMEIIDWMMNNQGGLTPGGIDANSIQSPMMEYQPEGDLFFGQPEYGYLDSLSPVEQDHFQQLAQNNPYLAQDLIEAMRKEDEGVGRARPQPMGNPMREEDQEGLLESGSLNETQAAGPDQLPSWSQFVPPFMHQFMTPEEGTGTEQQVQWTNKPMRDSTDNSSRTLENRRASRLAFMEEFVRNWAPDAKGPAGQNLAYWSSLPTAPPAPTSREQQMFISDERRAAADRYRLGGTGLPWTHGDRRTAGPAGAHDNSQTYPQSDIWDPYGRGTGRRRGEKPSGGGGR